MNFTRQDRLLQRSEFLHVYDQHRRGHADGLVVFVAENKIDRHRLGLTVSRKFGNAVRRNRIKRRLREAFRLNRHRMPGCYDIVVNPRRESVEMPFDKLADGLLGAVRRAARSGGHKRKAENRG